MGKVGAAAPGKTGGKTPPSKGEEAVKKRVLTKEDKMARKIQTAYRGYRCVVSVAMEKGKDSSI